VLYFRAGFVFAFAVVLSASLAASTPVRRSAKGSRSATGSHTATVSHKQGLHKKKKPTAKLRGQQAIQSERVVEIQQALIREHYLSGEPSGSWDAVTISAMLKLQADNGWQTKLTPDSRALKKLGLGPDYSNAINARGSSFADPPPASTIPAPIAAGFAEAAHVNR
jgi:peptidoglycan hydrolase-like protein with peptidoglycan-binding domain